MLRIFLSADDLTGSLDTGVQFAKMGFNTSISIQNTSFLGDEGEQIAVVDTESRHLSPEQSYKAVFSAVKAGLNAGASVFYKKTDSTMRGNIGSELIAMMEATRRDTLVFSPALPSLNRTVENGYLLINGIPVENTQFKDDPFSPVTDGYIPKIIHKTAPEIKVHVCKVDEAVMYVLSRGKKIIVVDASSDQDLEDLVHNLRGFSSNIVYAGAGGLAKAITSLENDRARIEPQSLPVNTFLLISGSINKVTLEQIECGRRLGASLICIPSEKSLSTNWFQTDDFKECLSYGSKQLKTSRVLIITTAMNSTAYKKSVGFARTHGIDVSTISSRIADTIGYFSKELIEITKPDIIAVFGGDTLYGLLRNLQIVKLTPQAEIFPGIVQSKAVSSNGNRYIIVSKAGGFGEPNLIESILTYYQINVIE